MENRPWLANYPSGVPANIDPDSYNSLVEFSQECFTKWNKKTAFQCMGKDLSYQELDKKSLALAGYLQSRGLKKGDRVAVMMPNLLQYPIAIFGLLRAGLIVVNTNPLYTPREMKHQFTDSGVKGIIIAENFAANLEKILPETNIDVIITTTIGELLGSIKGTLVDSAIRYIKRMIPPFNLPNTISFSDAMNQGKKFKLSPIEHYPEDVIIHQYTGGTTGIAKGAMLTNKNLVANLLQIHAWMSKYLTPGEEVVLSPLPLYHIFAFSVNCLAMMKFGANNVLITNPRDLSSINKEFQRNKISLMTGVNTLFNALNNNKDFIQLDFSALKISVGGGMAVQNTVAKKWKEVTGCTLCQGYGMTEASPVVTINPLDNSARLGSIGMPIPSTDVRIVGENGNILPPGQIGELQVQGPQVMKGYYNRLDETAKTIMDGWLCTGDMAKMDKDGYFEIVDRKKDMILVSGFNVFPNEIEDVLTSHPKILEVGAIGIEHPKSGEVVKVFIVKKDKSLTEQEVMDFAKENLTAYKIPKAIEFINELPKSNVGKVLRKDLKEL